MTSNETLPEGPRVEVLRESCSCNFCNKAFAHYSVSGKSVAVRLCLTCAVELREALRRGRG